jgi:hypothetical protein
VNWLAKQHRTQQNEIVDKRLMLLQIMHKREETQQYLTQLKQVRDAEYKEKRSMVQAVNLRC